MMRNGGIKKTTKRHEIQTYGYIHFLELQLAPVSRQCPVQVHASQRAAAVVDESHCRSMQMHRQAGKGPLSIAWMVHASKGAEELQMIHSHMRLTCPSS